MKSEKYLNHIFKPMSQIQNKVKAYDRDMVNKAIELAEQDAEERMRQKALKVFCASNCPKGCSFGADGNIGCGAKARFIQKLNEE